MATAHPVLDELFEAIGRCLTLEVAVRIAELRAPESVQNRITELAGRSTEGTLSKAEREEYEAYVSAGTFVGLLQSKARSLLQAAQGT